MTIWIYHDKIWNNIAVDEYFDNLAISIPPLHLVMWERFNDCYV